MRSIKPREDSHLPILCWAREPDSKTITQAQNLAALPFAKKVVALMPDAHAGYGMPIGGVLATDGVVVPNAVGSDIGCGMLAWKFSLEAGNLTQDALKRVAGMIRDEIPVGFKRLNSPAESTMFDRRYSEFSDVVAEEIETAKMQLGTLGGGNHFLEIQKDEEGHAWVMIHSGSRHLGKVVADHYNAVAIRKNKEWHAQVPLEWELAFLPVNTPEGRAYWQDMRYCCEFARNNRGAMMGKVSAILKREFQCEAIWSADAMHNYAANEMHGNEQLVVHRKGAIRAFRDDTGIIPGSQGSASFITLGRSNTASLRSSSHGAGRRMGRGAAIRNLDLAEEQRRLDEAGIVHAVRSAADLDEAPGAYKDIEDVMRLQSDLVRIVTRLTPLAVVKG